jgi:hypothetical protein
MNTENITALNMDLDQNKALNANSELLNLNALSLIKYDILHSIEEKLNEMYDSLSEEYRTEMLLRLDELWRRYNESSYIDKSELLKLIGDLYSSRDEINKSLNNVKNSIKGIENGGGNNGGNGNYSDDPISPENNKLTVEELIQSWLSDKKLSPAEIDQMIKLRSDIVLEYDRVINSINQLNAMLDEIETKINLEESKIGE